MIKRFFLIFLFLSPNAFSADITVWYVLEGSNSFGSVSGSGPYLTENDAVLAGCNEVIGSINGNDGYLGYSDWVYERGRCRATSQMQGGTSYTLFVLTVYSAVVEEQCVDQPHHIGVSAGHPATVCSNDCVYASGNPEFPDMRDLDSGELIVTYVNTQTPCDGEPTLSPDTDPDGCITFSSGEVACFDDNESPNGDGLCVQDGNRTVCPPDDWADNLEDPLNRPDGCGWYNGRFVCVPQNQGCVGVNGDVYCMDDAGTIDPDSPDHYLNGGNADGDPTNDLLDSRTVEEGGDPDRQFDSITQLTPQQIIESGFQFTNYGNPLSSQPTNSSEPLDLGDVSGGSGCDAPPVCGSEPILCAILEQAYEDKCALTAEPTAEGLGVSDDLSEVIEDPFDLSTLTTDVFVDDGVTASCPQVQQIALSYSNYDFDFTTICNLMMAMRPLVILIFSLISFRVVLESF